MLLTRVRRVDGNPKALRDALKDALGLEREEVIVSPLTKHVVVKGHVKPQVEKFLRERMF